MKTTIMTVILLLSLVSTAFAQRVPTFNEHNSVRALDDGREVEYFRTHYDRVHFNLPRIIRTLSNNGRTVRYDINGIDHINLVTVTRGAYLILDGIARESQHCGFRILYASGPVRITFSAHDIFNMSQIKRMGHFRMLDGSLMKFIGMDHRTGEVFEDTEVLLDFSGQRLEKTLTEPGLYMVEKANPLVNGVNLLLYIAEPGENITRRVLRNETAVPTSAAVRVDNRNFNVPSYNINGQNFMRIRDIGFIMSGTNRRFDISFNDVNNHIMMNNYGNRPFVATGTEMRALGRGNRVARPSAQTMCLVGNTLNTLVYSIDGSNFVRLRDIAIVLDFHIGWDNTTRAVTIDTNRTFSK